MAPTPSKFDYDFIVIGGGSGGLGAARRAAQYGKKVALIEAQPKLGGTCVNVGCVPKKICWHAADILEKIRAAPSYGFDVDVKNLKGIDWPMFKQKRDAYIHRLNGIYAKNVEKDHVEWLSGRARFAGVNEIEIEGDGGKKQKITGERICVAVGGFPIYPKFEGADLGITSDGFFELEEFPKRVVVVGAGYIAVELAGIFHTLGAETHLLIRHDSFLRSFDPIIGETVMKQMERTGIHVHKSTNVEKVTTSASGPHDLKKSFPKTVHTDSKSSPTIDVDCVLWAIGRKSDTADLGLDTLPKGQLKLTDKGDIEVDEYQETGIKTISAIGDVQGKALLTPVAIAAGRRLSNRLFGPEKFKNQKLSYENIPSVVFSEPPCGSVGLSEPEAREKYGDDKIKIYKSNFTALYFSMMDQDHKDPTAYKLVCLLPEEKVIGMHIIGMGSDEITQGFSVAIKMGATKQDFDDTVAIHPTSSEELVTMV